MELGLRMNKIRNNIFRKVGIQNLWNFGRKVITVVMTCKERDRTRILRKTLE
jgi:hypothetical protein